MTIRFTLEEGEIDDVEDGQEPDLRHEIDIDYLDFPTPDGISCQSESYPDLWAKDMPECVQDLWEKCATYYHEEC